MLFQRKLALGALSETKLNWRREVMFGEMVGMLLQLISR